MGTNSSKKETSNDGNPAEGGNVINHDSIPKKKFSDLSFGGKIVHIVVYSFIYFGLAVMFTRLYSFFRDLFE